MVSEQIKWSKHFYKSDINIVQLQALVQLHINDMMSFTNYIIIIQLQALVQLYIKWHDKVHKLN